MSKRRPSVMVGMSGGVDSTVAAYLLQEQGYEVVGVTFRLWSPSASTSSTDSCNTSQDIIDAKAVCDALEIPHFIFNYEEMFREKVIDPFAEEYDKGRTPNPCVYCNHHIKFDDFLRRARGMGYDYIATGHYAQIEFDEEKQLYRLKRAKNYDKDQSYVLYHLKQEQLSQILFPLGGFDKSEIRAIAEKEGFTTAHKTESQDICFVPDGDYAGFLQEYTGKMDVPGNFVTKEGEILGKHKGIRSYTVGQRKGLGISVGKPVFVQSIDAQNNTVVLGEDEDLFSTTLYATDLNLIDDSALKEPLAAQARIRYGATPAPAVVQPWGDGGCKVIFESAQRAATPGQSVVFYDADDYVLGGATIDHVDE